MCSLQTPGVTLLNTGSYNTDWWCSEAVKSFCLPIHIMIQVVWFNLLWYRKQSDCFRPVFSVFTLMCLLLPVSEDVTLEWKSQMAEDRLQHQTNHSHQSLHVNYSLKIDTVSQKKRDFLTTLVGRIFDTRALKTRQLTAVTVDFSRWLTKELQQIHIEFLLTRFLLFSLRGMLMCHVISNSSMFNTYS